MYVHLCLKSPTLGESVLWQNLHHRQDKWTLQTTLQKGDWKAQVGYEYKNISMSVDIILRTVKSIIKKWKEYVRAVNLNLEQAILKNQVSMQEGD